MEKEQERMTLSEAITGITVMMATCYFLVPCYGAVGKRIQSFCSPERKKTELKKKSETTPKLETVNRKQETQNRKPYTGPIERRNVQWSIEADASIGNRYREGLRLFSRKARPLPARALMQARVKARK